MATHFPVETLESLELALRNAGFQGEIETDRALRAAMSTDNSVYQIVPDLIVAPTDAGDLVRFLAVMAAPEFKQFQITARGGGTGTNGQSLNRGIIVDMRRHMHRLLDIDAKAGWADVEPGMVLDDLNDRLRPLGWLFAPETSTSTRCTIGGMVSTDASGKGSRVYGKTSDNIVGLEIARPEGLLSSTETTPAWAQTILQAAEKAALAGRSAFIANTPALNRRFTGYDLERACPPEGGFEWWRLFLGAEGTLGLISRIRVKLRRIEPHKRLLVVGFDTFRSALAAASPLLAAEPTAVEIMDERVQVIAESAGILARLPGSLQAAKGRRIAYVFVEFNGEESAVVEDRIETCRRILGTLAGTGAIHVASDFEEIRQLWAVRSAGVGLLGKVDGRSRPIAFVEDCVVPPENLPNFVEEFLEILVQNNLNFGIYGHVDVGCLHIRPALDIDLPTDREKLVSISDQVFTLTRKYDGIFWGEHGKGVRGQYLREWIGPEAYEALQGVKAAFDPEERFNPGKLVTARDEIMGIASTPFRLFNAPEGDPLTRAFRCNGNAQCLSYSQKTPMCPSFKATADVRHSPKGRADALRQWHSDRQRGQVDPAFETDLLKMLDGCLGCKACASSCPIQVDIPTMRSVFYSDFFSRNSRPLKDRLVLAAEKMSPLLLWAAPFLRPVWPLLVRIGERMLSAVDLPKHLAGRPARRFRLTHADCASGALPANAIILVQDWFTALFDPDLQRDILAGFIALGYAPRILDLVPAGKAAQNLGDMSRFGAMAREMTAQLESAAGTARPLVGMDPAFVMQLRQDYPKAGLNPPRVHLPQEFLADEMRFKKNFPQALPGGSACILLHCTEIIGQPNAADLWSEVFQGLGIFVETPATGCCGMAGLYGHERRHQPVSRKLFDLSWRDHSQKPNVVLTGFSCRCQLERFTGQTPRHPLRLIADCLVRS